MEAILNSVQQAFSESVAGVIELLEFDTVVLDHLVGGLNGVVDELERKHLKSAALVVANRLKLLKNIRATQSLRPRYETIHNQCVVLLVSYFDATMGDLFRVAVACALRAGKDVPAGDRSVELSWRNLSEPGAPVEALIAERIVDLDDISFQDMQSIRRAFSKNLKLDLGRNEDANDIILGQAARHLMAHAGGKIDERFRNQVSKAHPRRLKKHLPSTKIIQFEPDEVRLLASSMTSFVSAVITKIEALLNPNKEAC
jgi:hypothetical protein